MGPLENAFGNSGKTGGAGTSLEDRQASLRYHHVILGLDQRQSQREIVRVGR